MTFHLRGTVDLKEKEAFGVANREGHLEGFWYAAAHPENDNYIAGFAKTMDGHGADIMGKREGALVKGVVLNENWDIFGGWGFKYEENASVHYGRLGLFEDDKLHPFYHIEVNKKEMKGVGFFYDTESKRSRVEFADVFVKQGDK